MRLRFKKKTLSFLVNLRRRRLFTLYSLFDFIFSTIDRKLSTWFRTWKGSPLTGVRGDPGRRGMLCDDEVVRKWDLRLSGGHRVNVSFK